MQTVILYKNTGTFFLIFFLSFFLNAQEPLSIHLTEKDGLPDVEFYDLLEDDKGFIWLAADKGLYKYDGRTYKLFEHPQKRGRSLFSLKKDAKGRVWCNNLAGQFFYAEDDKLILFKNFQEINTLVDYYLLKNYLVIINSNNITFVNITTKKVDRIIKNTESIDATELNSYLNDIHFSSKNNIYKINDIKDSLNLVSKIAIKDNFLRGRKIGFKLNNKEYVLEQNENKLLVHIEALKNNRKVKFPNKINGVLINKVVVIKNTLFIITSKGVYLTTIIKNQLIIKGIYFKDNFLTDVIEDKNGNYWFSTLKDGVYIVSNNEIKNYNNISDKIVLTEKKDHKTIFLASANNFVYEYYLPQNKIRQLKVNTNTTIKTLFYNSKNNSLLIGSSNSSVVYHLKTDKFELLERNAAWKTVDFIKDDTYLISNPNNFSEFNLSTNQQKVLVEKRAYAALYNMEENTYYATMIDGFLNYNIATKAATYLLYNDKRVYGSKLFKLKNGSIWVATHNKGLLAYKNGRFIDSLVLENGLASNVINQIKGFNNELWISTDKGLQQYNTTNKVLKTLTKVDGLKSYATDNITILDSLVFLTTNKGLLSFNKNKVFKEHKKPILYFTELTINDSIKKIPNNIEFIQKQSEFKVAFNSNGFQSKKNTEYEYFLEGLSNSWTKIDAGINFVNFNSLPSGNFLLKVRAKNRYQHNYSKEITLPIKVIKPFYKTFWFLIIVLATVVYLIFRYFKKQNIRLRKEQKIALEKAEISKELVFSQLENLRSQMNPHFIFNALNSIQDFIILNEKKLARQYLVKFAKLIRIYLEHSQQEKISLAEEIKALQLYLELEKDRFNDDFNFDISIDTQLNLEDTFIPSLLLQPYIENALKHGLLHKKENKILTISFKKNTDLNSLNCIIQDNGIGREASFVINKKRTAKPTPFATSANQKRINLLNLANPTIKAKLKIDIEDLYENEVAAGTKIKIQIPLKY